MGWKIIRERIKFKTDTIPKLSKLIITAFSGSCFGRSMFYGKCLGLTTSPALSFYCYKAYSHSCIHTRRQTSKG